MENMKTGENDVAQKKQTHQHGKNGFVTAIILGTTNNFLFLQPKILLQQRNALSIELNILLL